LQRLLYFQARSRIRIWRRNLMGERIRKLVGQLVDKVRELVAPAIFPVPVPVPITPNRQRPRRH
jgi:hypothetical protein